MKTLRLIALLSLIGTILPFGAQAQKYDFSYSKIPQRDAIYCHNCSMEKLVWVGDNLFYGITCYTLVDEGVADEYFYPAISLIFVDDDHGTNYTRLYEISDTLEQIYRTVTLTLSNGETLTTTKEAISNSFIENIVVDIPTHLFAHSDKKTLPVDEYARFRYVMGQLQKYDIRRVSVDGLAFDLTDFHSAATLHAMMKTIAEKIGNDAYMFNISDTPASSPAAPAVRPRNISIADFVRHPFALASLSGDATYNEAKTAVTSQNWASYHPDNTAYITCYSNDGYNMAYQGHLPYEAQAYFLDNGKINSWSYAFYFSKERYNYETIHALVLRMKQELQQAGITLSPIQANFLYVVESNGIRLLMDKNTNEWLIYLSIRK